MADKELRFKVKFDENDFQKLNRTIDQMVKKFNDLGKSMQSFGSFFSSTTNRGSGAGGMPPPLPGQAGSRSTSVLSSAIMKDAEAFKHLAKSGGEAMRAMTDALKRGISDQSREIAGLDKQIKSLSERYKDLSESEKIAMQGKILGLGSQRVAASNQAQQMQALLGSAGGGKSMGLLSPVGSGAINLSNPTQMLQSMFGSTSGAMVALRSATMVGAGAMAVMNMSQGFNNAGGDLRATRGQMMGSGLARTMRGDITDALARRELAGYAGEDRIAELRRSGSVESRVLAAISGGASTAKNFITGGPMTGLSGDSLDNDTMQRMIDGQEAIKGTTSFQMGLGRAYGYANDTRASRTQGSRLLGIGFNRRKSGGPLDTYTPFAARLQEQGYNEGDFYGAYAGLMNTGGRRLAGGYAGSAMAAQAAGYGGYDQLLTQASRVGNFSNTGVRAQRALGGGIDTAAGIQLGLQAYQYNPLGITTGAGFLGAAQNGMGFTGGPQDFNLVQRAGLGAQLGTGLTMGMDPYQQGRNVLNAIGQNPGGSTYAQDYLGNGIDFKQMLDMASGGRMTSTAKALGLDRNMIKGQLSGSMSSFMDRYVDQGTSDPMARAIRGYRASGMSIDKYLQKMRKSGNKGAIEAIGDFYGRESGQGEEAGLGLAQLLSGANGKVGLGNAPAGGIDEETRANNKMLADQMRESAKQLAANFNTIIEEMGKNMETQKVGAAFGAFSTSIEEATHRLERLAGVPETDFEKGRGSTAVDAARNSSASVKAGAAGAAGAVFGPIVGAGVNQFLRKK